MKMYFPNRKAARDMKKKTGKRVVDEGQNAVTGRRWAIDLKGKK